MPGIGLIVRPGRKVGRDHLACLRGAVQNAPVMALAECYLAPFAERLLLWAALEKGRSLSSLTTTDCTEYVDFLIALGRPLPAP